MNNTSKIGLGTVQFGLPYGISNKHGQTSQNEVAPILDYARKIKIDVLDTAASYGTSEFILGNNNLEGFKIISKFIIKEISIKEQLLTTLKRLNVSSLYAYLAHRPNDILNNPKLWDELIGLKQSGSIMKIGFSFNEISEIELVLKNGFIPDIIQVPFNYFDNRFEPFMCNLKEQGCEIHARSPFLQGLFFTEVNKLPSFFDGVKKIITDLQKQEGNLAAMLLSYCIDMPFIDKVVFGVNNLIQLKDNVEKMKFSNALPSLITPINDEIKIPSKWAKI
jgi:aryl-alcohol dehydrogenase-like predicted oxidoreductase